LGPAAAWDALAASPEDPFLLLARHLDAIVGVVGASTPVLVLSYPNPAESFGLHRDVVAAYAASHAVEFVDFQTLFAERFSGAEAASLFAPHGHCNARGYEVMGDEVVRRLAALARR
jgi:lysophospholipase L1-like esterase